MPPFPFLTGLDNYAARIRDKHARKECTIYLHAADTLKESPMCSMLNDMKVIDVDQLCTVQIMVERSFDAML